MKGELGEDDAGDNSERGGASEARVVSSPTRASTRNEPFLRHGIAGANEPRKIHGVVLMTMRRPPCQGGGEVKTCFPFLDTSH